MGDAPRTDSNKRRRRGRAGAGNDDNKKNVDSKSPRSGGKHHPPPQPPPPPAQQRPTPPPSLQQHNVPLFPALSDDEPTWYQCGTQFPGRNAIASSTTTAANEKMKTLGSSSSSSSPRSQQQPRRDHEWRDVVNKYRALGDAVYNREVQLYARSSSHNKSADDKWVEATMHKGTLKDRIAAMSVTVSNDPIHKLYALDGLLQLAGCHVTNSAGAAASASSHLRRDDLSRSKPNSRVAQLAAQAMEDLFVNSLLPKDRKLIGMEFRPLLLYEPQSQSHSSSIDKTKKNHNNKSKTLSPRILLLWRFEEMVRDRYHAFVDQYLARTLRDGMEVDKKFCLRVASNLLRTVPEGEAKLLGLLVNKLGDPSRTICSSATHAIRHVLQQHPAMRTVVAREVQQLAHRPNLSARALYNCVNFLSQIQLDKKSDGQALASSLMTTYFRLFDVITGDNAKNVKDGETLQSRLLSALLTGVNRAHPYLPKKDQALEGHMDTLYRVAHTSTPAARTRALLLLFHVTVGTTTNDEGDGGTDRPMLARSRVDGDDLAEKRRSRFYRALFSTLSDPAMLGGGKHLTMYFNLLYKSLKYDTDSRRALAIVKRLLVASLQCGAPVSAATIFLVHEVAKHHSIVTTCLDEPLLGADALRVLDPTKREPRGALVVKSDSDPVDKPSTNALAAAPRSSQDRAGLWEIGLFQHHYHPSVAKFASVVGTVDGPRYNGDPLRDFGLQPFLDKFSYRNPKSAERGGATQAGQTIRRDGTVGRRLGAGPTSRGVVPPNDPSFLQQSTVDVQDEFFHKFFVERARRDEIKGVVRKKAKADEGDEPASDILDEQQALNEAEDWDGSQRFEDWEDKWETDPEEEAFVDSLTQRIIEDSIGKQGPDELDDEDPDMDGWDDMHDDDDDDDDDDDENDDEGVLSDQEMGSSREGSPDGDAFMEDDSSENSDDEEGMAAEFLDDGDNSLGEEKFLLESNSESDDDEDDEDVDSINESGIAALVQSSDEDDENDFDPTAGSATRSSRPNGKVQKHTSTFAAVEEYEDKINESWFSLKRSTRERGDPHPSESESSLGKKRKKNR